MAVSQGLVVPSFVLRPLLSLLPQLGAVAQVAGTLFVLGTLASFVLPRDRTVGLVVAAAARFEAWKSPASDRIASDKSKID